jgi:hypothetical protein
MRSALVLVLMPLLLLISACSDDNPPSPVPITPAPQGGTQLSPQIYVLRPDQLRDYTRTENITLDSAALAARENDLTLQKTFDSQGMVGGFRSTFQPPQNATRPFTQIISESVVFKADAGAGQFFTDEVSRRSVADTGQTLEQLSGLPLNGVDQLKGLLVTLAPQDTGPPPKAFFVLLRRGRVITELFGGGDAATATLDAFTPLVTVQEQLMAASPTA